MMTFIIIIFIKNYWCTLRLLKKYSVNVCGYHACLLSNKMESRVYMLKKTVGGLRQCKRWMGLVTKSWGKFITVYGLLIS